MERESDLPMDAMQLAEMERMQMSCELHDGVLQYLVSAKLMVEAIEHSSSADDPRLKTLLDMLEQGICEGREWIGRLRGDELTSQSSLSQSLRALCERFAESLQDSAIQFQFMIDDKLKTDDLDERVRVAIFRIAQESLRNAKLHSRCSKVTLNLEYSSDLVKLTVIDNGRGFDVERLPKGHYGILGMKVRSHTTGGHLNIRSSPEVGTTIEAAWTVG